MSDRKEADREGPLSRWSRRKREAAESRSKSPQESPSAPSPSADASHDASHRAPPVETPARDERASDESAVDLSALPPIESITAATDIRPFLAPGVPAELTRAALRRAWVADPAIRDFIGIAENQWDFNAPDGVPGFGQLGSLDVRRLLGAALGEKDRETSESAAIAASRDEEALEDACKSVASSLPEPQSGSSADQAVDAAGEDHSDAAAQKEEAKATGAPHPVKRGHGGALPQ
jgi:hypothetical protein